MKTHLQRKATWKGGGGGRVIEYFALRFHTRRPPLPPCGSRSHLVPPLLLLLPPEAAGGAAGGTRRAHPRRPEPGPGPGPGCCTPPGTAGKSSPGEEHAWPAALGLGLATEVEATPGKEEGRKGPTLASCPQASPPLGGRFWKRRSAPVPARPGCEAARRGGRRLRGDLPPPSARARREPVLLPQEFPKQNSNASYLSPLQPRGRVTAPDPARRGCASTGSHLKAGGRRLPGGTGAFSRHLLPGPPRTRPDQTLPPPHRLCHESITFGADPAR